MLPRMAITSAIFHPFIISVSDGGETPYRVKIRAPSFSNLYALTEMMKGWKIADVIAILGSIDIVLSDVDR